MHVDTAVTIGEGLLVDLTRIGSRLASTEEEKEAADILANTLIRPTCLAYIKNHSNFPDGNRSRQC